MSLSSTNIHDTQFDEEPTGTTNSLIEPEGNGDMCTDAATKLAESNHVMETAIIYVDCPPQQAPWKVDERSVLQNAGSSQFIIDSSPLRSAFESLLPSPLPLSEVSSHQALFVKNSPMWHQIEDMHVFKELPQQPHFLPLQKVAPTLREGMAFGMMMSFMDLVNSTVEASIDKGMEWFEDKMRTISHLEENGFSVQSMQSIMAELVNMKSEFSSYREKIVKLDLKLVKKTALSSRFGAVLDELDIAAAGLEQEHEHIRQELEHVRQELEDIGQERENTAQEKENIDAVAASIKTERSRYEDLCSGAKRKFNDIMSAQRQKTRLS